MDELNNRLLAQDCTPAAAGYGEIDLLRGENARLRTDMSQLQAVTQSFRWLSQNPC